MVAVSCGDAMINQYLVFDFLLKISTLTHAGALPHFWGVNESLVPRKMDRKSKMGMFQD